MSQIFRGRIKEMVRGSDLSTLSSKKIREQLEQEFKTDLSKRKKEIDDIVMGLLGASESQGEQSQNASDDDDNDISTSDERKKRKQKSETATKAKKSKSDSSSKDEELARMLQDEGRMRTRRKAHKEHKPKKKSVKRENTGGSGMFKKEMVLSSDLAEIMGTNRMPMSKVVQRMWQIVKERDLRSSTKTNPVKLAPKEAGRVNLQDPKNKQYHICDDQLLKVFGTRRVRTFCMMKYLKTHIKDPELLINS